MCQTFENFQNCLAIYSLVFLKYFPDFFSVSTHAILRILTFIINLSMFQAIWNAFKVLFLCSSLFKCYGEISQTHHSLTHSRTHARTQVILFWVFYIDVFIIYFIWNAFQSPYCPEYTSETLCLEEGSPVPRKHVLIFFPKWRECRTSR